MTISISYAIDIDPEILGYRIVKIILQPLVENALYHRMKDLEEGGCIEITGYKQDKDIYIEVYNTTEGI